MKPFQYHEDPLYAAATAILKGQTVTEKAEELDEYVSPNKTKAQKLQAIKDRRKEHEDAITKIRKRHEGKHSAERSGDDMRIIDMHNADLKKLAAREKKIMKMTEEGIELEESIKTRIADLLLNLSGSDTSDMIKLAANTFKKNAIELSHSVAADKKDEYKKAIEDMYDELLHSKTLTDFEKNGKKLAVQMKSFKEDVAAEEEDVSLEEGNGSYGMGTATITAPGNKLHGKQVSVFHKFDDGRLNVQYAKSDKKGDVLNLTLNRGQYKLDEEVELEEAYTTKNASVRKVMAMVGEYSNSEMEDLLFSLAELQLAGGNGDNVEQIALGKLLQKAATAWKKRSQFDESVELE
jgi:hypothetical protein